MYISLKTPVCCQEEENDEEEEHTMLAFCNLNEVPLSRLAPTSMLAGQSLLPYGDPQCSSFEATPSAPSSAFRYCVGRTVPWQEAADTADTTPAAKAD